MKFTTTANAHEIALIAKVAAIIDPMAFDGRGVAGTAEMQAVFERTQENNRERAREIAMDVIAAIKSSAPSSEEERPTFNRQVDGSNPSERTSADERFETKLQNPRYAKGYARAARKNTLLLCCQINEQSSRMAAMEDVLRDCEAHFSERATTWTEGGRSTCNLESVMLARVRDVLNESDLTSPQESGSSGSAR